MHNPTNIMRLFKIPIVKGVVLTSDIVRFMSNLMLGLAKPIIGFSEV